MSNSPEKVEAPTPLPNKVEAATEVTKPEPGGSAGDYFRIFKYADPLDRLLYAIAFVGAVASGVALPLMTLVFGSSTSSFNDYSAGKHDTQQFQARVNHLVLFFVYIFLGRFLISYIATLCVCVAAARTTNAVRKAFLDSLLRQGIAHFDMHYNGSVAIQVTTNGNRIYQGIAEKLLSIVTAMSLFFSAYIVAIAVQWKLALITMSIVPAIVLCVGGCISVDAPIEAKIVKIYSRAGALAQDILGSIKTVCAFGAQEKATKWYDEYLKEAHKEGNKKSIIYGVLFSCQTFLVMSGTALAFCEGSRLYQSREVRDVGTVITVILSVTLGATSVGAGLQIGAITNASSAAAELFAVIDKPSSLDPLSPEGKRPATCPGQLEIRNLHFAYPSRPTAPILQDFSLSIPAGKTTALVGPSGCGKSTIVGLLGRWYQPTSGQLLLDRCDITNLNTNWLRSQIRLVQQEPTLFRGTVFQNIAKGMVGEQLNLSTEDQMQLVKNACMATDAHDFIVKLPQGYYTELGGNASSLSGGQRQRMAIARSIVSDPQILLFDEATSALDPRTEAVVQDALNRVSANKTTLIIAHKLATVMAADTIAVMNNGRVVEQGSHAELLDRDGLYAAMVRAQDLGIRDTEHKMQGELYDTTEKRPRDSSIASELSLQQVRSETTNKASRREVERLTLGTTNYSLLRCIMVMLREHKDLYKWYLLLALAYVVVGGTFPVQAVLFSRLIGVFALVGSEAKHQADFFALMFFILALGNLLGYFCIGILTNVLGQTFTYRYRRDMFERILHFDPEFFDCSDNSSGALTARLSSVPSALQELMSANLGLIINLMANVTSSSVLAIAFGWKLGLTMVFAGLTVIVGSGYVRIRLDQKLEASIEKQYAASASLAAEAVVSIRTVSMLTLERSFLREYGETLDAILAKVVRSLVLTLIPYAFSQSADFLVMALGFWYGSRLIAAGEYTVSQFFVIFIAVVFGGQGAAQLFQYTTSITKAKGSANYILWLRTVTPIICATKENRDRGPSGDEAAVRMENVEFQYMQRKDTKVLQGISVNIDPGTYAAFVGPSGCGKSTIISLLQRFYDSTSGRITLNGDDITSLSPALYRQHISLVQQEPPLYLGSVRSNITLGLPHEPSESEILSACRQADAEAFIASLPEGLNTRCGSKGSQFSGGQRQRIALARALIRRPRLLLLDEATAAGEGRTTVAVAHRLSTIRHATVIFVVEDGRVVETGAHEELMQQRGRYFAMCLAQSLDQGGEAR